MEEPEKKVLAPVKLPPSDSVKPILRPKSTTPRSSIEKKNISFNPSEQMYPIFTCMYI